MSTGPAAMVHKSTRYDDMPRKSTNPPKPYPTGPTPTSPEWKQVVKARLAGNRRAGRKPSTIKQLAQQIGADPSGLYRMLDGPQPTSRYTAKISEALAVPPPVAPHPVLLEMIGDEEFDRVVERMRHLSPARRKRAIAVVQTLLDGLDELSTEV